MAEETLMETAPLAAPSYSLLEQDPAEALSALVEYVNTLRDQPSSEAVSEKFVLANVMAAEIVQQNQIGLDFELKGYILKAGKKITVTRRERVLYNFDRAAEEIFRMHSRLILKTRAEENFKTLSRDSVKELRKQLDILSKELRPAPETEDAHDVGAKLLEFGNEVAHWLRSGYDVIRSHAPEPEEEPAPCAPASAKALAALDRVESLLFGESADAKTRKADASEDRPAD